MRDPFTSIIEAARTCDRRQECDLSVDRGEAVSDAQIVITTGLCGNGLKVTADADIMVAD